MKFKLQEDGSYTDLDMLPQTPNCYPAGHPKVDKWIAEGNTPDPYVGPSALEVWKQEMAASDALIPRWAEDLYNGLSLEIRDGISAITKNKIVQKKSKRELRPS
tara:strand:+ start:963 stop:1274 length:312 start_codon:yes stop_codon:yes gene_type:complete